MDYYDQVLCQKGGTRNIQAGTNQNLTPVNDRKFKCFIQEVDNFTCSDKYSGTK